MKSQVKKRVCWSRRGWCGSWLGGLQGREWVSGWGNMEGSGGGRIQDEGTEFAVKVGDVCCGRGGGGCGRRCGS
jgi:hypothetical protein